MNEQEMREAKVPWPDSLDELTKYIDGLVNQEQDYGTCVYAMSMAAVAAFFYVSGKLGCTGFQASCADLDILRRTRHMEHFRVVDYGDLMYPQYRHKFDDLAFDRVIKEQAEWLGEAAQQALEDDNRRPCAHPNVRRHWQMLAALPREKAGRP